MPDIIHLLPDSVANQIAAGEVIQRPASALKELMENSIDSGANQIDVIIKDAGKTLLQVTDNGSGMSETDARLSFERHATSKINKVDDLFEIRTMGFRGEALASIAAIAQVEMKTKKADQELGTCIINEGSQVKSQEACQCPAGTTIMVKNLFYNVPARRKFLKANTIEIRHIIDEFQRVALARPDLNFSLFHDRKPVFQLKASNLKQRIISIFGNQFNQRLVQVEQKMDILSMTGFIGKPEFAKKTRGEQFFFVNQRFMKHPYLNHAVDSAFDELMPEKSFPSYFIFIEIDPKEIDINIHPTKTEIKFQDEKMIYSILRSAVKQALGKFSITPSMNFEVEPTFDFRLPPKDQPIHQPQIRINPDYNPFERQQGNQTDRNRSNLENWEKLFPERNNHISQNLPPKQEFESVSSQTEAGFTENLSTENNFYQLHRQFILSQIKSGLMVIDQQKAHERILYERYIELMGAGNSLSQQELFPIKLSLSPADAALLNEVCEELNLLGFSIKPDEKKSFQFVIDGTPAGMKQTNIEDIIGGILEAYKTNLISYDLDKSVNLARSMAKNLAIKSGKALQNIEMRTIIDELFACKIPEISLDGESIVTIITLSELSGRFSKK
jgi:DNA mismatch repair protein MutL